MKNAITFLFLILSTLGFSQSVDVFENSRILTEINDTKMGDAYPWINSNGLRIYYTKEFESGQELVFSERKNYDSEFSKPIIVHTALDRPISAWLSENELTAFISNIHSLYVMKRASLNSSFGMAQQISLDGAPTYYYLTSPSLNGAEDELYASLKITETKWAMARFTRTSDLSFEFTEIIHFPGEFEAVLGQLSKNGLSICVTAEDKEGKEKLFTLSRSSLDVSFQEAKLEELDGLNSLDQSVSQVSLSYNAEWIVGVVNSGGYWDGNDLVIAQNTRVKNTSTSKSDTRLTTLKVYPNPSDGAITIATEVDAQVEVINSVGQQIDSFIASSELVQYQVEEKGMFIIRVLTSNGIKMQKVVVR